MRIIHWCCRHIFLKSFQKSYVLPRHEFFSIRDPKDEKILYSAITADVDVLITGDKDFTELEIERPEILIPSEFIKRNKIEY